MANKSPVVAFKQSGAADVVKNRVRFAPPNSAPDYALPFDEVTKPVPDSDGYSRIPFSDLPKAQGLDGTYDVHVTAVDDAGLESGMLEIDNQTFDFSPPEAPTDGRIESGE